MIKFLISPYVMPGWLIGGVRNGIWPEFLMCTWRSPT